MEYEKTEKRKRVERVRKARQVIFIAEKDLIDFLAVLCLKVILQDLPLGLLLAEGLFLFL